MDVVLGVTVGVARGRRDCVKQQRQALVAVADRVWREKQRLVVAFRDDFALKVTRSPVVAARRFLRPCIRPSLSSAQ